MDPLAPNPTPSQEPVPYTGGPRSQKARGIAQLNKFAMHAFGIYDTGAIITTARALIDDPDMRAKALEMAGQSINKGLFVRPCPLRPRHGFVESRRLPFPDLDQLEAIAREVIAVEPDAEIVLMRYYGDGANFILNSAGVTVGPGHDGATSGHGACFLPVPNDATGMVSHMLGLAPAAIGIGADEDVYIEAVMSRSWTVRPTQLRAGPKLPGVRDYIPKKLKVKQVVTLTGDEDLLAWETTAKELPKGSVVYHPGGSLSSHFGVHCALNGVPYLTSREPQVGKYLSPTARKAWGQAEYARLMQLVAAYDWALPELIDSGKVGDDGKRVTRLREALYFAVAALHALPALMQSREEASLRAVAFGLAVTPRLFTALTLGEARHWKEAPVYRDWARALHLHGYTGHGMSRNDIYAEALYDLDLQECYKMLARTAVLHGCESAWPNGYGGEAWEGCALSSLAFTGKLLEAMRRPGPAQVQDLLEAFNRAINEAHNNGWWLNKFADKDTVDRVALYPALGFLGPWTLPVLTAQLPAASKPKEQRSVPTLLDDCRRLVAQLAIPNHRGNSDRRHDRYEER